MISQESIPNSKDIIFEIKAMNYLSSTEVDLHQLPDRRPTHGTHSQMLAAPHARRVMLAGHVHTVFLQLEADVAQLHHGCLGLLRRGLADTQQEGVHGADLEAHVVAERVVLAGVLLGGETQPGAVSGVGIFDKEMMVDIPDVAVGLTHADVFRERET